MTRSSKHYKTSTRVRRPNHLPVIFNTARLRSASARVRRLALTVLHLYVYCLLLLAARSCVQLIGYTAEAVKTLATDSNQSNLSLVSDQSPDECPLTEVIDDCLSCLFRKWAWHGPGDCDGDCPQVAVYASDGDLITCHIEVPLQDTLQNQTVKGSVRPEETSGQCHLPLPMASYSTAFKTMFHGITFLIDFILWHTTLVSFSTFVHMSLILYEFGPPLWTMNRETWRKLRKASSLSGKRGISRCQKTRVFLCVYLCGLSSHYLCMAVLKRFKHQILSKQIYRQLARLPSLGLGRGVRCGQKIHGRLVTSFNVQTSFVKRIRVRPHCPCPVLLSRVVHHSKSITKAVTVRSCVFLGLLLILAGDVERNPGPKKDGSSGPMSPWNVDALVSLKERLKLNVVMNTGLSDRLEKAAGGFMSRPEVKMVRGLPSNIEQIDNVIETLRGKTNEDFATFCTMLRETNHVVWADELEKEAERFRRASKSAIPSLLGILRLVVPTIAAKWKELGQALGVKHAILDTVRYSEHSADGRALELLALWSQSAVGTGSQPRTWHSLLAAVETVIGRREREKIEAKLNTLSPSSAFDENCQEVMQPFFSRMQEHYVSMPTVQDEWFPNQSMSYVNLALAPLRLGSQQAHERFVEAVKEGAENVYTYRTSRVESEAIPQLVKERKFVVLSGAPGVGKSTLARKVCQHVCCSPNCHGYSLVLLVELRKLLHFKNDFQLVDILQLFEGMMGGATSSEELSKAIHRNLGKSVLFILDGFDELPPHLRQSKFLTDLLSHNLECSAPLPYCHVVMTSQSIVTSEIYHSVQGSLSNIEVLGFTRDQIKEYAGHILVDTEKPELLESFLRKIDSVPQIRAICSIPVVLSIICQVFSFKEDLPPTLTEIYNEYMCIHVLKYHDDLTTLDSILDLPRDHDIYTLGKIAFDCIRSQKMVFQSSDLQGLGDHFSDRIKGCGVLTARPVRADPKSKRTAIKSFYFIHLTFQEFLAAVYVSLLPAKEQREIWSKYLGEPHMAQVWRFYCGLTKLTHYELLQANITAYPKDFQMQCLFESQNASLVQKLMPHIVGEEVKVKPKTVYDSIAYGYCLSKHPTLMKLTIETRESAGLAEIHRLLEPVCASGTLQMLCLKQLGSPEDWRQVEDLFDRIRNCDGALKGHFGKMYLEDPPLSVAVKLLCLHHVCEVECCEIQGCEAMDHEVLKNMEKALGENKTLKTLTVSDGNDVTLPKEFFRHLMLGIKCNTSLSEMCLGFDPRNWPCPNDVPADIQESVQHVTLYNVPVDVLPRLFLWFSQVKHFKCHEIRPPQEDEEGERDVKFTEVEKTLSGMGRLEMMLLGIGYDCSDSLMVEFGVSVLAGISGNKHTTHFALYNWGKRNHLLRSIIGRIPSDVQRQFTIDKYTNKYGYTFPCISRFASETAGFDEEVNPIEAKEGETSSAGSNEEVNRTDAKEGEMSSAETAGSDEEVNRTHAREGEVSLAETAGSDEEANPIEAKEGETSSAETTGSDEDVNQTDAREGEISSAGFTENIISELYQKAITAGPTITLHVAKAMTIGPPRVGKTCFRHHLLGLQPPQCNPSTPVMKTAETINLSFVQTDDRRWIPLTAASGITSLLEHVREHLKEDTILPNEAASHEQAEAPTFPTVAPSRISNSDSDLQDSVIASSDRPVNNVSPMPTELPDRPVGNVSAMPKSEADISASTASVVDKEPQDEHTLEKIRLQIYEMLKSVKDQDKITLPDAHLLQFIDCGGQLAYHDIIPIFVNIPAIYLHVFNLTVKLTDCPKDHIRNEDGSVGFSAQSPLTNAQMMARSVLVIRDLARKRVQLPKEVAAVGTPQPSVAFIGTHYDTFFAKYGDQTEAKLKDISKELKSLCIGDVEVISHMHSKLPPLLFPINNYAEKATGEDDRSSLSTSLLKEEIEKVVGAEVKVPVTWYLFQLLQWAEKGKKLYRYGELCKSCAAFGLTDKGDIYAMVSYFHALGLFLHHCEHDGEKHIEDAEGCKCLVFTDPSHLFENITKLYKVQFLRDEDVHDCLEDLKKYGKLTKKALTKLKVDIDQEDYECFMNILVKLSIGADIVPSDNVRSLFVPSVLTNSIYIGGPSGAGTTPHSVHFAIAFIHENDTSSDRIFIPCGVFTGMIARLQSTSGWAYCRNSISRLHVEFQVSTYTVKLYDHTTHIGIVLESEEAVELAVQDFRQYCDTVIEATANSYCFLFHSNATKQPLINTCNDCIARPYLILGRTCQKCTASKDLHFLELKKNSMGKTFVRCQKNGTAYVVNTECIPFHQRDFHCAVVKEQCTIDPAQAEKTSLKNLWHAFKSLLHVVLRAYGSVRPVSNESKMGRSWTEAAKVTVQVIKERRKEFLREMSAKDIALQLKVQGEIPESVEHDINHSKCREDANGHLLTFLLTGASENQVQQTLKVASEKINYGRMSQFASDILQQLQPEPTTLPHTHEDTPTLRLRHGPHHTTRPSQNIGHTHTDTPTSSSLYCSMLTLIVVAIFSTLCLLLVIMTLLYVAIV